MGEAKTEVKFRVHDKRHREQVFEAIMDEGFRFEVIGES
jgi:hypothetical protein